MKGKVLFLVAGAAGYVLGARAGRERYEQISSAASRAWGNPKVQSTVSDLEGKATDVAKQAGAKAQEKVSATAGSVAGTVRSKVNGGGEDVEEPLGEQHHTRMPTD
ncbi:YtxH domain-containing protein [Kineococcus auxinigenes]|uniref:YtxH domain-containing protein n=1 Tax=unclassified Kineococcus TaxID=2621656 RepID=UPI003D7EB304